jgi:triphosphoribosyl-dephospho-CoA synthetase
VGHHAVQEMMEILGYRKVCSHWVPVFLRVQRNTKRLESALLSILQSGFGPLRLPLLQALERSREKSPLRDWRGSPGSRAKLVARSWNVLLPQRNLRDSATLAEMHRSGWRFYRKLIKDA